MSFPDQPAPKPATPEPTAGRNWFKIIAWTVGGCGCILPLLALGALILLGYILHPNAKPYVPRVTPTPTAVPAPPLRAFRYRELPACNIAPFGLVAGSSVAFLPQKESDDITKEAKMAIPIQITFDCADPARLAAFWAEVLGYKIQDPPEGFETWEAFLKEHGIPESEWNSASAVVDPEGKGPRLYFQQVKEPKVVKNRVHLDVSVSRNQEGTNPLEERKPAVDTVVERLIGKGATRQRSHEERGEYWVVMQDPEGNEFCLQ